MKEDHYILLVQKRLTGILTAEEQSQLDDWLTASPDNQRVSQSIEKAWSLSAGFTQGVDLDLEADFQKIENKLGEEERPVAKIRPLLHRRWLLRVAAVFLLLAVGPYIWRNYLTPAVKYQVSQTGDEAAKKPIELLDGSKVWLNANSKLTYFTTSVSKERRVKIEGEAFFEVAKDASKPFVVETPSAEVTVLGTSFSVSEKNDDVEVKVATGKVSLSPKESDQSISLEMNERGIFKKTEGQLVKEQMQNLNELAWHTKKLVFENTPLATILSTVSNFYKTPVHVEDKGLETCPLRATFEDKPLSTVLETLTTMLGAESQQLADGGYILKGGQCQ